MTFYGPERYAVTRFKLFPFLEEKVGKGNIVGLARRSKPDEWFVTLKDPQQAMELHDLQGCKISDRLHVGFFFVDE